MLRGKHKKLQNMLQKRPSAQNKLTKTQILYEHTAKIQQKLSYLKQKISQKKKLADNDKVQKIDQILSTFMTKLGLVQYTRTLIQNGIDSFEILKQIKQSQLQQIGILKGHALKIVVHVKKQQQKQRKKSLSQVSKPEPVQKARQQTKPTLSQTIIKQQTAIDSMQTQGFPLQDKKKSFCLYCFTRSESNFCSSGCQGLYNKMFQKYELNLHKAQQQFMKPQGREEQDLSDNQQFLQNFDFLFNPQLEDFDKSSYEEIKQLIKK